MAGLLRVSHMGGVLVTFLATVIEHLTMNNLREEGLIPVYRAGDTAPHSREGTVAEA